MTGRPRDPTRDHAIAAAVVDLLAEVGYPRLTVDAVAARAGVAKTTLYRRWPTKQEMVLAIVDAHLPRAELPDTSDPVADMRALVALVYAQLAEPIAGRALPLIAAELAADPRLAAAYRARFVEPIRAYARRLLGRVPGISLTPAERELLIDAVIAPAVYRPIALGEPASPASGVRLFDLLIPLAVRSSESVSPGVPAV